MPNRKYTIIIMLISLLCVFNSCHPHHHTITKGFYYWKTNYKPTAYEEKRLNELGIQKMYVRLFDVDWDEQLHHSVPVAPVHLPDLPDTAISYVPVVFITQRVLGFANDSNISAIAGSINSLITTICPPVMHINEVQIDCDWNSNTKDIYFKLLRRLRDQPFFKGRLLSCTIRLHQVKYTGSNGIPPVDRGMLMCYSMGDLKKYGPYNSILDISAARDYLKHIDTYPLQLDIALPLFRWCILFHEQKYKGILHDVQPADIKRSALFHNLSDNLYTCLHDTVWNGYTLLKDDVVRTEEVSFNDILRLGIITSRKLTNPTPNIVFFSSDSITLSKYANRQLEKIYLIYK